MCERKEEEVWIFHFIFFKKRGLLEQIIAIDVALQGDV